GAHPDPPWLVQQIDRAFEKLRGGYLRALGATLRHRPKVFTVWAILSLVTIPMYMFSPAELAPAEDQGGVFTSLDVPANASLEQVSAYAEQIGEIFQSMPEFDHSFQIAFPTGGFGGMLAKPWKERKRSIFPIQQDLSAKTMRVAGVRAPVFLPP